MLFDTTYNNGFIEFVNSIQKFAIPYLFNITHDHQYNTRTINTNIWIEFQFISFFQNQFLFQKRL